MGVDDLVRAALKLSPDDRAELAQRLPQSLDPKERVVPERRRTMREGEPRFARYIGIDYSGAESPTTSLKGLRVYQSDGVSAPVEVLRPPSPRKYWSRNELAEWLAKLLREDVPTLVGIDHAFSFPLAYFERHHVPRDWSAFLDDFQRHWPTDEPSMWVDFVREGDGGNGAARTGERRWRRMTELRCGSAKSVFHFDVQGQVAKSTHAGLPWLRFLRRALGDRVHFWPFDGWQIPAGRSAVVEIYPRLWGHRAAPTDLTADQRDAYLAAAWMKEADATGELDTYLEPDLPPEDRAIAEVEGWILCTPTE